MATIAEVAAHLDLSGQSIRDLKKKSVIPGALRGQMDMDLCRQAYIRHLRERAAGRAAENQGDDALDLVTERAKLAHEQAEHWRTKNAVIRGDLAAPADITPAVLGLIELSKARLMRIPARIAKGDAALRALIADAIETALEDLTLARIEEDTAGDVSADDEPPDPDDA